ncbi:MAG: hypothetical protein VX323_03685, partial [Pseudomonadota bacterium]|nr:hypothetical protein [Pseudomonadota bacterium]
MAKLYFLPRVALKAQDALLPLAWRLEAAVVRWTFRHLRRLPLEDAQARAARWFRRIGPRTPVAQKLLRNLAILHPEAPLSALKVEARDSFAALGQAVAELAHSDAISENPERFCEFTVDPAAEVALSDPQAPAVLITAHVGPWSLVAYIGSYGTGPRVGYSYMYSSHATVRTACDAHLPFCSLKYHTCNRRWADSQVVVDKVESLCSLAIISPTSLRAPQT